MALPVRRTPGRLVERGFPGWTGDPLAEFDDLFGRMSNLLQSTVGGLAPTAGAWAPLAEVGEVRRRWLPWVTG